MLLTKFAVLTFKITFIYFIGPCKSNEAGKSVTFNRKLRKTRVEFECRCATVQTSTTAIKLV